MKKISVLAAALAIGAVSFVSAEGFKFSGYVRSGASVNTKGETFDNATWQAGDFFGGSSRVRMNLDWSNANGGATLRYQKSGAFADDDWFDSDNIKYAMAYETSLMEKSSLRAENCLTATQQQAAGKTAHSATTSEQDSEQDLS
ncbi:MAG: hypothetical protein SOT81_11015 [Treponema sp.]|nr:hypothetical protein [Treponema sp.]